MPADAALIAAQQQQPQQQQQQQQQAQAAQSPESAVASASVPASTAAASSAAAPIAAAQAAASVCESVGSASGAPSRPLGALKHRLLAALHADAMRSPCPLHRQSFFRNYEQHESLLLWKAQFIDEKKLLLRFVTPEAVSGAYAQAALLAVYDVAADQITQLFRAPTAALMRLVDACTDDLRVSGGAARRAWWTRPLCASTCGACLPHRNRAAGTLLSVYLFIYLRWKWQDCTRTAARAELSALQPAASAGHAVA